MIGEARNQIVHFAIFLNYDLVQEHNLFFLFDSGLLCWYLVSELLPLMDIKPVRDSGLQFDPNFLDFVDSFLKVNIVSLPLSATSPPWGQLMLGILALFELRCMA